MMDMSPYPKRQPLTPCPHCGHLNEPFASKYCLRCRKDMTIPTPEDASPFDAIRRTDGRGDYWDARELMPMYGYGADWRNFARCIEQAKVGARSNGLEVASLFGDVTEKSGGRPRRNYRLVRHAAYLTAMEGDPAKAEIAAAKHYFAIRTQQAEQGAGTDLDELEVAERYVASLRREKALAAENAKLRVKAEAFDLWLNGKGCYLVGTVAKMLNLGPKALWDFLYAEKLVIRAPGTRRHREPYARPDTKGWFEVEPVPPDRANGHATKTTAVTPYGAEQIRLRLIRRGVLPPQQLALIEGTGA